MERVKFIHCKPEKAKPLIERLEGMGYEVEYEVPEGSGFLRGLKEDPPAAVVIDLSRLPSHGRDIGMAIREYKATRNLPLVFAAGDTEKVGAIRAILPDAKYTCWKRIKGSLARAIAHPTADPLVPRSRLEGYAGKPLHHKLGIKADMTVALAQAPPDFDHILGKLPPRVKLRGDLRGRAGLILWFVRSRKDLEDGMEKMANRAVERPLWVIWPKKASVAAADLSQQVVRETAVSAGLVDYKICSVDETWSGLLFKKRKKK